MNTFGHLLRVTTFGESHGPAIGCVLDGQTATPIETYGYDATGNRQSVTNAGLTTAYTYPAGSHRLDKVGTIVRTYDASGNTTKIGGSARQFVYDPSGRMTQVKAGSTVTRNYRYNAKGEQTWAYLDTANAYFVYDKAGHLLGEYASDGSPKQQMLWFGDLPVGVLEGSGASQKLHYVEPDHLGAPRVVIDGVLNVPIWEWKLTGEAFGATPPNQNPDGDANPFVFNLRYPGQRYDSATGLNYNYFRDYDPGTGRYVQSDPIGLKGGISTYSYVLQSPLKNIDPNGLAHLQGFVDRNAELLVLNALVEARQTISRCVMGECRKDYEDYFMSDQDKQAILDNLFKMTIVYNPTLQACGTTTKFQSEEIEIGPLSFSRQSCCSLAATLAHEANHLGRNWGNGRGVGNARSFNIEKVCFGCTPKIWR